MSFNMLSTKNSVAGYFIIEGVDGCGKTECIAQVKKKFESLNIPVTPIREPGTSPVGTLLREYLASPSPKEPYVLLHMFMAARAEMAQTLYVSTGYGSVGFYRPEGTAQPGVLISDRGFPSSFVFQLPVMFNRSGLNDMYETLWEEHERYIFPYLFPQAVVYLDVSAQTASDRTQSRVLAGETMTSFDLVNTDLIQERIKYYDRALSFFVSKGVEVIRIPAEGPREEVADATFQALSFLFQPRNYR